MYYTMYVSSLVWLNILRQGNQLQICLHFVSIMLLLNIAVLSPLIQCYKTEGLTYNHLYVIHFNYLRGIYYGYTLLN